LRWFYPLKFKIMAKHLSQEERNEIWRLLKSEKTQWEIGIFLGRSQGTISREITNNTINDEYCPIKAGKLAQKRRIQANINNTKLLKNEVLRTEIIWRLTSSVEDWSPDTISWRMRKEKVGTVTAKTIYNYIYHHDPWLRKSLRYKKGYQSRKQKEKRVLWDNKKRIEEREEIIEKRIRIWDVEVDTVVSRGRKWRVFTAFDRKSRLCWLRKANTGTAKEISKIMIECFKGKNIKSITADNGLEFADRELTELYLQIPFIFANPYHSWERWTNENGNRCLRKHIPKKMDFSNLSDATVSEIEKKLNSKPRKIHNYRTPFEVHYHKKTQFFS